MHTNLPLSYYTESSAAAAIENLSEERQKEVTDLLTDTIYQLMSHVEKWEQEYQNGVFVLRQQHQALGTNSDVSYLPPEELLSIYYRFRSIAVEIAAANARVEAVKEEKNATVMRALLSSSPKLPFISIGKFLDNADNIARTAAERAKALEEAWKLINKGERSVGVDASTIDLVLSTVEPWLTATMDSLRGEKLESFANFLNVLAGLKWDSARGESAVGSAIISALHVEIRAKKKAINAGFQAAPVFRTRSRAKQGLDSENKVEPSNPYGAFPHPNLLGSKNAESKSLQGLEEQSRLSLSFSAGVSSEPGPDSSENSRDSKLPENLSNKEVELIQPTVVKTSKTIIKAIIAEWYGAVNNIMQNKGESEDQGIVNDMVSLLSAPGGIFTQLTIDQQMDVRQLLIKFETFQKGILTKDDKSVLLPIEVIEKCSDIIFERKVNEFTIKRVPQKIVDENEVVEKCCALLSNNFLLSLSREKYVKFVGEYLAQLPGPLSDEANEKIRDAHIKFIYKVVAWPNVDFDYKIILFYLNDGKSRIDKYLILEFIKKYYPVMLKERRVEFLKALNNKLITQHVITNTMSEDYLNSLDKVFMNDAATFVAGSSLFEKLVKAYQLQSNPSNADKINLMTFVKKYSEELDSDFRENYRCPEKASGKLLLAASLIKDNDSGFALDVLKEAKKGKLSLEELSVYATLKKAAETHRWKVGFFDSNTRQREEVYKVAVERLYLAEHLSPKTNRELLYLSVDSLLCNDLTRAKVYLKEIHQASLTPEEYRAYYTLNRAVEEYIKMPKEIKTEDPVEKAAQEERAAVYGKERGSVCTKVIAQLSAKTNRELLYLGVDSLLCGDLTLAKASLEEIDQASLTPEECRAYRTLGCAVEKYIEPSAEKFTLEKRDSVYREVITQLTKFESTKNNHFDSSMAEEKPSLADSTTASRRRSSF